MTVYISPVGYDSTRVTRPILSEGIDDGDQILLLRPDGHEHTNDARASEAINDIERMVNQVQPEVAVVTREIPREDFQAAVLECSSLITDISDSLVINFGGGPRDIYLAVAVATMAHLDAVEKSLQFSDLDGSVKEIPIPRISGTIPESAAETLKIVVEHESRIGIPDLADELDKAKSTVSRHVRILEDMDAVSSEMHGKTKYVRATFSGQVRYRMTVTHAD